MVVTRPRIWVLSLAGPRVLHEAKVEQPNTETTCASCPHADVGSCNSVILVGNYTMFSAPGRGPCGGPRSCLLCNWASCRTGMLHSGHTFRTSSHLIRHLQNETAQKGRHQPHAQGTPAHTPRMLNTCCPEPGGVNSQVLRLHDSVENALHSRGEPEPPVFQKVTVRSYSQHAIPSSSAAS